MSPNPNPNQMVFFESPVIGPWFSNDIELAVPNNDLSITLAPPPPPDTWFLAPISGTLSLFISKGGQVPDAISFLKKGDGSKAFAFDRFVVLFRLLPEIEERIYALQAEIPVPTSAGATGDKIPTRCKIRYFALEISNIPKLTDLCNRVAPEPAGDSDKKKAEELGFLYENSTLSNDKKPMYDFKKPGALIPITGEFPTGSKLFKIVEADANRLWVFDSKGFAVDPGAVACWWKYLSDLFPNLWAGGMTGIGLTGNERTARVPGTVHRCVQFVNPHGTPKDPPGTFLTLNNSNNVTGNLKTQTDETQPLDVNVIPGVDIPKIKVALLPYGTYGEGLSLWDNTFPPNLTRDFIRVSWVNIEEHLVGVSRSDTNQGRKTTRVNAAKTGENIFLNTTDEVSQKALEIIQPNKTTWIITPEINKDWGPFNILSLPEASLPKKLGQGQIYHVIGAGELRNEILFKQKVMIEFPFEDANLQGAWVRAWAQGIDTEKGIHYRINGGAGKIYSNGNEYKVSILLTLPDGAQDSPALLGFDVLVVTAAGSRLFADVRFERPDFVDGTPTVLQNGDEIIFPELGEIANNSIDAGKIQPGMSVVIKRNNTFYKFDHNSLANNQYTSDSLIHKLTSDVRLELTEPAWPKTPTGNSESELSLNGANVHRAGRNMDDFLGNTAGGPIRHMDRHEILFSVNSDSESKAVVGSTPNLSCYHESGETRLGHPGVPAHLEVHGSGVYLDGPAALLAAEISRDRVFRETYDLISSLISDPVPGSITEPTEPGCWVSVLKTVSPYVEGEIGLGAAISESGELKTLLGELENIYNETSPTSALSTVWTNVKNLLIAFGESPPFDDIQDIQKATRLLARRLLVSTHGAFETLKSLKAAFQRAEDLIYIETPAIDGYNINLFNSTAGIVKSLMSYLKEKLENRPGLRVLICIPHHLMPGTPKKVERVRNKGFEDNYKLINTAASDRIIFFKPAAGMDRSLRMASTTVIVDDVYALIGTTHLSRKGLTFNSSVSVAAFGDNVIDGVCKKIREFRKQSIANRLSLKPSLIPNDAEGLLDSVLYLIKRNGLGRIVNEGFEKKADDLPIEETDINAINPDATVSDFNILTNWIVPLAQNIVDDVVPDSFD